MRPIDVCVIVFFRAKSNGNLCRRNPVIRVHLNGPYHLRENVFGPGRPKGYRVRTGNSDDGAIGVKHTFETGRTRRVRSWFLIKTFYRRAVYHIYIHVNSKSKPHPRWWGYSRVCFLSVAPHDTLTSHESPRV